MVLSLLKPFVRNLGLSLFEGEIKISDLPDWGFDGSSTNQAAGNDSDCELKPVRIVKDPLRGEGYFLALCEVYNADGTVHTTNKRASLVDVMERGEMTKMLM